LRSRQDAVLGFWDVAAPVVVAQVECLVPRCVYQLSPGGKLVNWIRELARRVEDDWPEPLPVDRTSQSQPRDCMIQQACNKS
jgi:hypothetical protein